MSIRGFLAELRYRGVFKVAAVYIAVAWLTLQGLSLLFQNFGAPDWVLKVTTTLLLIGFPVACLMAWGFDITPEGVRPIPLACALDDEDAYAHATNSCALLWNREHDQALAEVQRCLALAPSSAEGNLQLSNTQYYLGDCVAALKALDAYVRLDPLYPEITLYFLAEAQAGLGQFDAAVATLKRRLERNPNSETSYALLASCYGHLGRIEESRQAWAQALRIAPGFSLERRRRVLPYRNPEIFELRIEGLRKAGLPV